jgi:hypothetical protein
VNPDFIFLWAGIGIGASGVGLAVMTAMWFAAKVPNAR